MAGFLRIHMTRWESPEDQESPGFVSQLQSEAVSNLHAYDRGVSCLQGQPYYMLLIFNSARTNAFSAYSSSMLDLN